VRYRPHPGECKAARHADQELLPNPQIDDAVGVAPGRPLESVGRDVGEYQRKQRIIVKQLRHHPDKALPHAVHRTSAWFHRLDDRADGTRLPPVRGGERRFKGGMIAAIRSDRRPSFPAEPGLDSARPAMGGRGVVHHDAVQGVQASPPGEGDRLVARAFIELPVADQDEYPGR